MLTSKTNIIEWFKENLPQEAIEFLLLWLRFCHEVDDQIDKDKPLDIITLLGRSNEIYNHYFYRKYHYILYTLVQLVLVAYKDSVAWEKSEEEWKRKHADILRHYGYNMVYAVILICCGFEKLDEFSEKYREYCHKFHLKDIICH